MDVSRMRFVWILAAIVATSQAFINVTLPPTFNPDVTYFQENPDAVLNHFGFVNLGANIHGESEAESEVVEAGCGGASAGVETTWHSPDYPKSANLPSACTLNLTPPKNTCAYRVTFADLVFTPVFSLLDDGCQNGRPSFQMSHSDGISTPICTDLTNFEGIMEVDPEDEGPFVLLLTNLKENFKFKINATAVACGDIKTYKSPNICGIQNEIPGFPTEEQLYEQLAGSFLPNKNLDASKNEATTNLKVKRVPPVTKKSLLKALKKRGDIYSQGLVRGIQSKRIKFNTEQARVLGVDAGLNQWPWMVLVKKTSSYVPPETQLRDEFLDALTGPCSAVLIDSNHVMTSSACILSYNDFLAAPATGLSVVLGDHNRTSDDETTTVTVSVSKVTIPLTYNPYTLKDDLAVLELAEHVQFNKGIRPICLPVDYNVFPKEVGVVSGWGSRLGFQPVNTLVWAPVKMTDGETCNSTLSGFIDVSNVNLDDYICAGIGSLSPVCNTDLGTPLFMKDQTGAYFLVGVSGPFNVCFFDSDNIFIRIKPNSTFVNMALH